MALPRDISRRALSRGVVPRHRGVRVGARVSCVNTDRRQPSLARVAVAARRRRARGTAHFFEPALSAALEQARGDPAACEPPVLVVVRRVKSSLQIWPLNLFYELVVSEVGKGSFAPKMTSSPTTKSPTTVRALCDGRLGAEDPPPRRSARRRRRRRLRAAQADAPGRRRRLRGLAGEVPAVQPLREKRGEGSLHAMQARVLLLARVLEGGVETRDLRVLLK